MAQTQILIVDDQLRMAQSISRILAMPEGGGYRTEICDSGEAALERLGKDALDLVIAELRMPGMSGSDLLARARLLHSTIKCILMTRYDSPEAQEQAGKVADAYLVKPVNPRELVETVRSVLQGRSGAETRAPASTGTGSPLLKRCEKLRVDVGAVGVLVLDRSGQIVAECGERGDYDVNAYMALLNSSMEASRQASDLLGQGESFDLHVQQGKKYDVYTARSGPEAILSLTIDRRNANASSMGMVWVSLRRAIGEIRSLTDRRATSAQVERPAPEITPPAREPETSRLLRRKTEAAVPPPPGDSAPRPEDRPPEPPIAPPPTPGEPPPPSVFAPDLGALESRELLTYQEALRLGLIDPETLGRLVGEDGN